MDEGTARDYIEDLKQELDELRKQLRAIEAERDYWQRQATNG